MGYAIFLWLKKPTKFLPSAQFQGFLHHLVIFFFLCQLFDNMITATFFCHISPVKAISMHSLLFLTWNDYTAWKPLWKQKRQIHFPWHSPAALKNIGFLKSVLCSLWSQNSSGVGGGGLFGVLWAVLKKVCSEVGLCKLFCLRENKGGMSRERYFRVASCKWAVWLGVLMQSAPLFLCYLGRVFGCRGPVIS